MTTGSTTGATLAITGGATVTLCVTNDMVEWGLFGSANGASNPNIDAWSNAPMTAGGLAPSTLSATTAKGSYTLTPIASAVVSNSFDKYTINLTSATFAGSDTITLWYSNQCSVDPSSPLDICGGAPKFTNTSFTITLTGGASAPAVTAISPTSGTTAGGTPVTITGTGFTGVTAVTIGGTAATSVAFVNDTTITAVTPAHAAGTASVLVTTPAGTNAANTLFTYVAPPTVTSISPNSGGTSGGTPATITGTGFTGVTGVTIGGAAATGVVFINATTITAITPAGTAGARSVLVTTPAGTNAANTLFTYVAPPTVTSISPTTGSTAGGTPVTITGTGFTGATAVTIGGAAATGVTVVSATSITATTPAGTAGARSVLVTTPAGTNAANTLFTYVAPPTVTAISPTSGTTLGGTPVTITGTGFTGATAVTIGGSSATGITVVNATTITATTPAGTAGTASVLVTTPAGTNAANTLYTYVTPAPTVSAISPTSGTTFGGTPVTITGTSFTGATAVTFGGSSATSITVVNATTITATTPAGTAGTASVLVTTPAGTNAANTLYTYVTPAPTVSAISPTSGTTFGGTPVTITGTSFTGATAVTIGGSSATGITVVNATTITATTPAGTAGTASVLVTTPAGTNAANTLFTYVTPAPTVSAISPTSGTTVGGTPVTITGTSFTGATAVTIGGSSATGITVVNATTITATTPAGTAGTASVLVTTPAGTNAANTLFTYVTPAPTVTAISPTSGTTFGGTPVTITGTSFTGATAVTIGGSSATGITLVNATTITATTPAGTAGTASVLVTTLAGTNAANTLYTYVTPAPTVTAISPTSGTTFGGTPVTITGTSFTGATAVTIGGTAATGITVVNATTITATTPAGTAGTASVLVTTPAGTNTANALYTYVTPIITVAPPAGALPGGTVGIAYSQTFTASGGTIPYSFTISAGTLPAGLTLAPTGELSGTPTVPGPFGFSVTATDANSFSGAAAYALAVSDQPPVAGPVSATVAANSSANPIALNTTGTVTSVAVSTPPTHGSANVSGVTITYTPAAGYSGPDSFRYTATNTAGTSAPATVSITVTSATIAIAPGSLPEGTGGVAYGPVTLTASGGTAPYAFAIATGSLPGGLTLSSAGTLSGTPTATGSFPVSISATDTLGSTGTRAYTLSIIAVVPVAPSRQAQLLVGTSATVPLTPGASGGPFTAAAISTPPPASTGTATIVGSGGGYNLVYASSAGAVGTVVVAYTLSNQWGVSAPATVTFTVIARPDPSQDPEVGGLINAQVQSARQFATSQIRNFNDRLERVHTEAGRHSGAVNVRIGMASQPTTSRLLPGQQVPEQMTGQAMAGQWPGQQWPGQQGPGQQQWPGGTASAYAPPTAPGAPAGRAIAAAMPGTGRGAAPDATAPIDLSYDGFSFWAGGFVNFGTTDNGSINLSSTLLGISAGVDQRFSPDFVAGIGIGYGRDAVDIGSNGTESDGQAYSAAIYASYHPDTDIFIDALLGFSALDFSSERYVTSTGGIATGDRTGSQIFSSLTLGYEHQTGPLMISPYGRAELAWSQLDGFTETGGGIFNLIYGDQDSSMIAGVAGLRAEYEMPASWSLLTARGRLEYTHDFAGSSRASMGYADLNVGLPYGLLVDPFDQNYLTLGLGLDARFPDGAMLEFDYRTMFGMEGDEQNHSFALRFGMNF